MKIKEWKYRDMMNKVLNYGDLWMNLDAERTDDELQTVKVDEAGFVKMTCRTEVIKETEKAVFVEFGNIWKEWIPKSCIA